MLEVGRVVHARGEHDDRRVVDAGRRRGPQGLEQLGRVAVDRQDPVAGEQLREDPGHHPPVLDDVGDARRAADVVLEHVEAPVRAPHHVDAGHVDPDAVRRVDAEGRPVEVLGGGDQPAGHDPVVEDLAPSVDVGQEGFEGLDPLGHAGREDGPLLLGDDPRHQVERERALLARELEGDAPVPEAAVAGRAAGFELVRRQRLQGVVQGPGGGPGHARRLEHLVPRRAPRAVWAGA